MGGIGNWKLIGFYRKIATWYKKIWLMLANPPQGMELQTTECYCTYHYAVRMSCKMLERDAKAYLATIL